MAYRLLACLLALWAADANPLGTLRQQVRRTKKELESKTELADYHASPYSAAEIVERIHALENPQGWKELCAELALLPDDELELFEDAIRRPEHARRMPCAAALLRRIDAHWRGAAERLAQAHPAGRTPGVLELVRVPLDPDRTPIIVDGDLPEGQVALTFDDGPHPTRTPRILAILAAAGVKATFFEIGRNAAAYPEISRQVLSAGHSIGSHTFSHPDLPKVAEGHAESEIESGDASVSLALGLAPGALPFFRFPYGAKTAAEQSFVEKRGNTTFFWSIDSQDWRIRDPHLLFLNVLSQLDRNRHGVILFHDIHEQTVIALPHLLAELQLRHFKAVVFVAEASKKNR